jgi:hypothetical protein
MKHIVKYGSMLRESEERKEATDLNRLNRLGLISDAEYVKTVVALANEKGIPVGDLLEPGKMIFEIEGDDDDGLSTGMREAMASFEGPKGELPVLIIGKVVEPYYDFAVTMSDGSIFRMDYQSFYAPQTLSLERGGTTYELDEESRAQLEETLANHGEWSMYLIDALWMLLDLANNK